MDTPPPNLEQEIWRRLASAAGDPLDPMRLCTVATVLEEGGADARLLLLRGADADERVLWFHCDRRSRKVRQLKLEPNAAVVCYDPEAKIQFRMAGEVSIHEDDAIADQHWAQLEFAARDRYAQAPEPDVELSEIDPRLARQVRDVERSGEVHGRENFAALMCVVSSIDWLRLGEGADAHAVMRRDEGWRARLLTS